MARQRKINRRSSRKKTTSRSINKTINIMGNKNTVSLEGKAQVTNQLSLSEKRELAKLKEIIDSIRQHQVESVLNQHVFQENFLNLNKNFQPQAVKHLWSGIIQKNNKPKCLPANTRTIKIFEKAEKRLLILGEPGSGKTVSLLELAGDLLDKAEKNLINPIPIVFNLSSWTGEHKQFEDWLKLQFEIHTSISSKEIKEWLKNERILPLLDGLDEVAEKHHLACIDAINHAQKNFPGMVVCCRVEEYEALSHRLKLNRHYIDLSLRHFKFKKLLFNFFII